MGIVCDLVMRTYYESQNKKTYQEIMYEILDMKYKKQAPILNLNKNELKVIIKIIPEFVYNLNTFLKRVKNNLKRKSQLYLFFIAPILKP